MTRTIEITIVAPRLYEVVENRVYVKFLSRIDAENYVKEDQYDGHDLMPYVDYDVERDNYKYWRVYIKRH